MNDFVNKTIELYLLKERLYVDAVKGVILQNFCEYLDKKKGEDWSIDDVTNEDLFEYRYYLYQKTGSVFRMNVVHDFIDFAREIENEQSN